eukprot:scaffold66_cov115-Cylindrotheca_fusiformis.AAC.22
MSEEKKPKDDTVPKGYRKKKEIPGVDYLLKHGDPESEGKPKTFAETYSFPIFVVVMFILSFFVFYYFIENHTTHRPIVLPRMPKRMDTGSAQQQSSLSPESEL